MPRLTMHVNWRRRAAWDCAGVLIVFGAIQFGAVSSVRWRCDRPHMAPPPELSDIAGTAIYPDTMRYLGGQRRLYVLRDIALIEGPQPAQEYGCDARLSVVRRVIDTVKQESDAETQRIVIVLVDQVGWPLTWYTQATAYKDLQSNGASTANVIAPGIASTRLGLENVKERKLLPMAIDVLGLSAALAVAAAMWLCLFWCVGGAISALRFRFR